jgi:benzoyl-CoA reductase subunit C
MGEATKSAMDTLLEVARNPSRVAEQWKAEGGKVMGTRCIFVPDEVVWAAGMLPFPLYGTPEPVRQADAYFQSCSCEFVRNVFDLALDDRFAFLDGLAMPNTCDAIRRLYDLWAEYRRDIPAWIINNPQKLGAVGNEAYWLEELKRFQGWVEQVAGTGVTDEKLRRAIGLYNETRALLKRIWSLRREESPPLSGEEALLVGMAATIMPRDRANDLLRRLLEEITARKGEEKFGPRILVTGSIVDHPAVIRMIEEEGGLVVAEDLCTTMKTFWHPVEEGGPPLESLVRAMNRRPLCACMHPFEARLDYLQELVDEFRVDAVINFNLKYCHSFLYDAPLLRQALEKRNVPVSVLETGHDMSGHGQLRTRVQAFIEMLDVA